MWRSGRISLIRHVGARYIVAWFTRKDIFAVAISA